MIDLINVGFHFGGRYLYKDVNWSIKPGQRIGLVGQNGTGKTTLLYIITGEYTQSEGDIQIQKSATLGFLNQDHLSYQSDDTIKNVAMMAFERQLQLQKEIDEVIHKMEIEYTDELMHQLSDKQEEFGNLDGYTIESKTSEILEGLGFTTADLERPLKEFSGGWRMRVMLAKMLLQKPSLLMLDEPTNHLDLPSIQWLEQYLQTYEGTIIVVSHDREFLDRLCNTTVEVASQRVNIYPGNYSYYLEEKAIRQDQQQKSYDNQQAFIRQQERFIERFKAKASKATAAQSRVKLLDKIDRIEAVEDATARISLRFPISRASGKVICTFKNISKNYGDQKILENANAELVKGDKIALIGANGKGKSTVLRLINGTEKMEGTREMGYNVISSFYAQHQLESLGINNTLLEELSNNSGGKTENELRTVLGCFLFTGDEVFKKIKVLSGGEKARVALAKTLLNEANFLLLDEPTNHLDIQSINMLIEAMQAYEGSFITVSHDRHFIKEVANKIWWIEDNQIKEYPGTYDEFNFWNENIREKVVVEKKSKVDTRIKEKTETSDDSQVLLKKLKKEMTVLEEKITQFKTEIARIETELYSEDLLKDAEKMKHKTEHLKTVKNNLSNTDKAYEEIFEKIMELEG